MQEDECSSSSRAEFPGLAVLLRDLDANLRTKTESASLLLCHVAESLNTGGSTIDPMTSPGLPRRLPPISRRGFFRRRL